MHKMALLSHEHFT